MRMIEIPEDELRRHLGVPPGVYPCRQWPALIAGARRWCQARVRPWVRWRRLRLAHIGGGAITLDSWAVKLHSTRLAEQLRAAGAGGLVVAAISAGPCFDSEVRSLWAAGRPDMAMMLHAYGSALVETLRARLAAHLNHALNAEGLRLLPYLSPGYDGWPLEDQANLFALLADRAGPIRVLKSGGLTPGKSTLLAFGVAPGPSGIAAGAP